ncbi:oxidoreductase [Aestuariivirga sp.]|uniref:oxidoreductase n=1 Tax=Aestuariivirga sp. TaxID=2650926 RepID=UPI0039E5B04B
MGRVAIITGGAQGLGAAIARSFLAHDFTGCVLVDRNADGLATVQAALGKDKCAVLAADLTAAATPKAAVDLAVKSFGRVDVLVNAAGNTERWSIDEVTPEAFDKMFDVNVKAATFMMQAAAKEMRKAGGGVVINIASMLSYGGPPNLGVYAASKAALVVLSRNAANAWKREGIRVFAVNLGWVATDGEHRLQTTFHKMPENWAEVIGKRMPFGRLQKAEDVAGLCQFLVSPPAQMMTGAVIDYEQMPTGVFDSHPALAPE